MENEKKVPFYMNDTFQWILSIVVAIVIALGIRAFIFEPVKVEGQSMDNTLNDGQRLFEYKMGYMFGSPKIGDIVILKVREGRIKYLPLPDPTEVDYIKRVIGTAGDLIDIKGGKVYRNGEMLDEEYALGFTDPLSMKFPVTVPDKKLFVLGDNRQHSSDSRSIGFIELSNIRGKAVFRIWPLEKFGVVK